jgi:hypothetical protein
MVSQLRFDGRCSGDYADELWPRSDHLGDGQKGLVKALAVTVTYLAKEGAPPVPAPVGLEAWLTYSQTTLRTVHDVELQRRQLAKTGGKREKSLRIVAHVTAFPGGYMDNTGMHRDARPSGYDGDLPEEGGGGVPAGGGGDGGGMVDNDEHEGDVEHDEHGGDDDDDDDDGDQ